MAFQYPNNPPKVLLIAPDWPPSHCGVADFSKKLFSSLKKHNSHCDYFICDDKSNLDELKTKLKNQFDVVHLVFHQLHEVSTFFFSIPVIARKINPRVVIVTSVIEYDIAEKTMQASKDLLMNSDGLIVYDSSLYEKIKTLGRPQIEMACGATIEPENREIRNTTNNQEVFCAVFFGFLNPKKGIETILESLNYIPKKIPIRYRIKAGLHQSSNIRDEYEAVIANHVKDMNDPRLSWECRYYETKDVNQLLENADCCILPFLDGLSNKRSSFFSALSFGLHILTTNGPSTPQIFREQTFIDFFRAGDPRDLARQVLHCFDLREKDQRQNKIFDFYNTELSWIRLSSRVLLFYSELEKRRSVR